MILQNGGSLLITVQDVRTKSRKALKSSLYGLISHKTVEKVRQLPLKPIEVKV